MSSVLSIAYLSTMQFYFKPIRKLSTGLGFSDIIFIPKPEYKDRSPALVIELKWNKTAISAINQIKDKEYPESTLKYTGDILLVGINYDKKTKKHDCMIESFKKS